MTFYGTDAAMLTPMMTAPMMGQTMTGPSPVTGQPLVQSALAAPAVAAEAMRQQSAALLQRCYRWLEAAMTAVPQVAGFVPPLVTAVAQYEAQQYDTCLAQTAGVLAAIRQLQQSVPTLPPL